MKKLNEKRLTAAFLVCTVVIILAAFWYMLEQQKQCMLCDKPCCVMFHGGKVRVCAEHADEYVHALKFLVKEIEQGTEQPEQHACWWCKEEIVDLWDEQGRCNTYGVCTEHLTIRKKEEK